ncbi:MAG: KaiC 1, partial [Chthoniobacteraceae bacterium]
LSDEGIRLVEVYLGREGVFTGTSRVAQEARERAAAEMRREEHERHVQQLKSRQKGTGAQIAALQAQAEAEAAELAFAEAREALRKKTAQEDARALARRRGKAEKNPTAKAAR